MHRIAAFGLALLLALFLAAPAVLAQDGSDDGLLMAFDENVTLPADQTAGAVLVVQGDATIAGTARSVTVVGGTATLEGATVGTLIVIDGTARLLDGTAVSGDVLQLNGNVEQAATATVGGQVRPFIQDVGSFVLFVGASLIALWIGAVLLMLVTGLAVAGFAARQVRTVEAVISNDPLKSFVVGLLMLIVPPVAIVLLALTVVGLPLALTLLFFVWPTIAFAGWVVAAIWIGDWLLRAAGRRQPAERPYLAAVVGLIVAGLLGIIPFVAAVTSIFGLGALTVAGWRTLVGTSGGQSATQPYPTPVAG
jgi:hypothetical protein